MLGTSDLFSSKKTQFITWVIIHECENGWNLMPVKDGWIGPIWYQSEFFPE